MVSEAQAYWKDWIDGERSVPALRAHIIPLLEQARLASQRQDWEAFQRLVATYSLPAQYCESEPLLTTYEWGLMSINVEIADDLSIRGDLEQAMHILLSVRQSLRNGDERRAHAGMTPRPNSELRLACLGLMAACLLEDYELFPGQPEIQTSLMAAEFWRAAETLISNLQEKNTDNQDYVRILMHVLARHELEICKLCWRYNPSFAEVAIELFNGRTGNQLETLPHHFARLDERDSRSAWYWDFELSKLEAAGDYSQHDVLQCSEQRRLTGRLSVGSGPLPLMEQRWSRQIQRLLGKPEKN